MIKVDLGATEKYRYVPGFRTGGTFGVNMHTADDKLFSFNYTSIHASEDARLEQHTHFVLEHYLKQFNQEIIQPKNFAHCGEPCAVACKKFDRVYKKDYEPYQALGPLCGVFDQRAAEELNHFVDAMGWDAIQAGGTVSWIMELVHAGMIPPGDFGLPLVEAMKFEFQSHPEDFDLSIDSHLNAEYAKAVVEMILLEPQGEPFRQGLRAAAKILDQWYGFSEPGERTIDRAVFTSHSDTGCMVPNQYWVPGMLGPMPMMGKYFVYYGVDFLPPQQLGRRSVERMVYELFSENSGVCRFHRKWVEAIVDDIISAHYGFFLDYKAHQFDLTREILEREGDQVVFWESERTIDVIWRYLEKWAYFGLRDEALHDWVARFRSDKWAAARAYWDEMRLGIAEAIQAGPDAIPDVVAPYQAARLDIMVNSDED
jgi:glyceraldehyde-3-phosphate dehydrogenase (ferredoxin)